MFFVLAMVIGYFQYGFSCMRAQHLQLQTLHGRTGMVAAFLLMDVDESGRVSRDEFLTFMR